MYMTKIGIIGIGFVGGAMYKSFQEKNINVYAYDKYKQYNTFEDCLNCNILFLCLPTPYDENNKSYDKSCIYEICDLLHNNNYNGLVVIRSTVEPETINILHNKYPLLKLFHNPEFLTARTAFNDFHNMEHIVIGYIDNTNINILTDFYKTYYPQAEISICKATESEAMKLFLNCFYSVKIQFFNEMYLLCQNIGCDYNNVVSMMLKNKWINPMHTKVPGPDGQLSYGGYCFPKDTNALLSYMKDKNTPHMVLDATVNERNLMRTD